MWCGQELTPGLLALFLFTHSPWQANAIMTWVYVCGSFDQFLASSDIRKHLWSQGYAGNWSRQLLWNKVFYLLCTRSLFPPSACGEDCMVWLIYVHAWVVEAGGTVKRTQGKTVETDLTKVTDWKKSWETLTQGISRAAQIFKHL